MVEPWYGSGALRKPSRAVTGNGHDAEGGIGRASGTTGVLGRKALKGRTRRAERHETWPQGELLMPLRTRKKVGRGRSTRGWEPETLMEPVRVPTVRRKAAKSLVERR